MYLQKNAKWLCFTAVLAREVRPTCWTDKQAHVCSLHFTDDDYENLRQYNEGFACHLLLKAGAVPRVFGEPVVAVEEVIDSLRTSDRAQRLG